jgi:hypothetical protein
MLSFGLDHRSTFKSSAFFAAPPNCFSTMPAYRFKPVPVPDNSVWQGKYFHLTYKSFITITMFLAMVASTTSMPIVAWSYAHELGAGGVGDDEDEDEYEHSHFAIIFLNKIKIIGSRKFDIIKVSDDGTDATSYHPHILPKLTIGQMETIFLHYHVGRKYSPEEGKVVYKKPVRTENYIAPFFEFLRANINEVIEAPSLLEACVAGEVRPRSVLDIQALRNEAQMTAAATFKHLFSRDSFLKIGPDSYGALHIWGGSGLGKTKWACAQFHNPLLIKPFNKVGSLEAIGKKFNAEIHDGIVLDEADLTFMTREQVIAFLDVDEPCDLGVRYKTVSLPAGVKKIFVSNPAPRGLYPSDPFGAIERRLDVLHITSRTFTDGRFEE